MSHVSSNWKWWRTCCHTLGGVISEDGDWWCHTFSHFRRCTCTFDLELTQGHKRRTAAWFLPLLGGDPEGLRLQGRSAVHNPLEISIRPPGGPRLSLGLVFYQSETSSSKVKTRFHHQLPCRAKCGRDDRRPGHSRNGILHVTVLKSWDLSPIHRGVSQGEAEPWTREQNCLMKSLVLQSSQWQSQNNQITSINTEDDDDYGGPRNWSCLLVSFPGPTDELQPDLRVAVRVSEVLRWADGLREASRDSHSCSAEEGERRVLARFQPLPETSLWSPWRRGVHPNSPDTWTLLAPCLQPPAVNWCSVALWFAGRAQTTAGSRGRSQELS